MFTFHVDVPQGVTSLDVTMDYLSPALEQGFSSGASATDQMCVVSWNQALLYPKGYTSDELTYKASLKLPTGWKFGTSLAPEQCTNLRIWRRFFSEDVKKNHLETLEMLF